jgi:hypothetical protein
MFTVGDIMKQRLKRASVNHETYKMLYTMCKKRIKHISKIRYDVPTGSHYITSCTWHMPNFIPGRPVYKPARAARYVLDKLQRGGFDASFDESNDTISIDWTHVTDQREASLREEHNRPKKRRSLTTDGVDSLVARLRHRLHMRS